jgi:hypothetical protein
MSTKIIRVACCLLVALAVTSCARTKESVEQIRNGAFKVDIRSQELNDSGLINTDLCVADASDPKFPEGNLQCFLHGYDIVGLKVAWLSQHEIEVSIKCGEVTGFSNDVIVLQKGTYPVEFHAVLRDNANCPSSGDGHP